MTREQRAQENAERHREGFAIHAAWILRYVQLASDLPYFGGIDEVRKLMRYRCWLVLSF